MGVIGLAIAGAATATYVAGAVTGAVIGGIVIGAIGAATIGAVAGAAVSMLLSGALIDEPSNENFASFAEGVLLNKRANSEPIPIVYGKRLVGGIIVTLASHLTIAYDDGSTSAYLYVVLVVSEGEIESYDRIFYDNKQFTGSTIGVVKYFGTETQEADPNMVNNLRQYTKDHRLKGTAYLRFFMKPSNSAYPNGLPKITAEVKGIKLYDPRSGLTVWSDNPALCIRDYLTNKRYGRGIDTSLIDDDSFIIAANYCDEYRRIFDRYVRPFRCNGVVATENSSLVILKKLLSSCRGLLIFSGGKYKLIIDKPEIAGFTFNEDNIIGGWSIALGSKNTKFNRIRANFFNKNKEWQADIAIADSPELRSSEDDGIVLERTIDLPYTDNLISATVIARINLNQSRQSISCDFTSTIEGLRVEVGDVVYISHATPGWVNKKFRVMKMALQNKDEVQITATEYSENVYDFGNIQLTDDAPDTQLDDISTVLPPSDLLVHPVYHGLNLIGMKVAWTASPESFVEYYIVQYKHSSETTWLQTSTDRTIIDIAVYGIGYYNVRVRAVNTVGARSEWLE